VTRLSGRFAVALIAIFAVSLAPVLLARTAGDRDECASESALFDAEALYPNIRLIVEGPRSTNPQKRRMTGIVDPPDERRRRMIFTITRTLGLPNGLLQPAAALPGDREPDVVETALVPVEGATIPIRYAYENLSDSIRTTAYFMTLRGKPISSPLWGRIAAAPSALLEGRWPITLFVISTRSHESQVEEVKEDMNDWIRGAWNHYHAVCPG